MLIVAEGAKISHWADIEDSVRGTKIIIEDGVQIDSFVKIKSVGGSGDLRIGANSLINSGVVIYTGNGIQIGRDVLIAANCTLAPVNHEYVSKKKKIKEQRFMASKNGIVIEDDVWIGANSVILDGAIIRKGAVIGANSLVRGELEAYGVYVGSPVKLIRRRM